MMRETGAVISGSAALALLHPLAFEPNNLDFYVSAPGYAYVLRFVEDFGYKIIPNDSPAVLYDPNRLVVVKLVHPITRRSINVVTGTSQYARPVDIITKFHSTLVMNFIAYHGVVSLYPRWTLRKEGFILKNSFETWPCFTKYDHRGFGLHRNINDLQEPLGLHCCWKSAYCPLAKRSIHDGFCFYQPFSNSNEGLDFYETDVSWTLSDECGRLENEI
jgi:hypothetical protein